MASDASASDFSNSILICVDCGEEFVFTASAQQYFAERGFLEPPKRCKFCYNEYRSGESSQGDDVSPPSEGGGSDSPDMPIPPPDMKEGGGAAADQA